MAEELAGKVAVVTGAARGLGKGIAQMFVAEGAKVVIADLEEEAGRATAAELGDAARFFRTDVSQRNQVQALVDYAVAEFAGLHVLVNNAGMNDNSYGRLVDDEFPRFDLVMNVNVLGTMLGTQIAGRHMAANGGGSIINISSLGGLRAGFGLPVYRASKAAVQNFTQTSAIELGEHFIRVNAICPSNVPTDMGTFRDSPGADAEKQRHIANVIREVRLDVQPIKREGRTDDIANAALYLASDRASYVTGQIIAVDGGAGAGDTKSLVAAMMAAKARVEAEYS